MNATNFGNAEFVRAVRRYHNVTSANRGPDAYQPVYLARQKISIPDVIAIKIMKNERSGYRSPMVAETEGNHSSGYP